ncbi:hypothetical protein [Saccharibacillus sp. JS10]|uniref:hypothetical protein n=1 Tax=Saccharibacillus sp. JS10 TaxID=2950552 RepID=UPI002109BFB7|nr:hypothetical protein [Saccharibacillus sp. JS10]MCQ4086571.1 hypothetical protein [Saccharibacillus sp. JS10]
MKNFQKPALYIVLFLIASIVLAYTTYHYAKQNQEQMTRIQEKADTDFDTQLGLLIDEFQAVKEPPASNSQVWLMQRDAAKLSALSRFTSYYAKEPYVESITNRLDHFFANYGYGAITEEFDEKRIQEWTAALQALSEDPTDFERLDKISLLVSDFAKN